MACAAAAFAGFAGDVLVLYGDVPLIRPATLRALAAPFTVRFKRALAAADQLRLPLPE